MSDSFRRLLGLAAVVAGGFATMAPAGAQWGYPATAPYYGSGTFASSRYSAYGPGYAFSGPAYHYAPYHLQQSPYGYTQPYGYGIYGDRGIVDWDDWSPFGEREIEYHFRRDGTVRIDIDD